MFHSSVSDGGMRPFEVFIIIIRNALCRSNFWVFHYFLILDTSLCVSSYIRRHSVRVFQVLVKKQWLCLNSHPILRLLKNYLASWILKAIQTFLFFFLNSWYVNTDFTTWKSNQYKLVPQSSGRGTRCDYGRSTRPRDAASTGTLTRYRTWYQMWYQTR